MLQITSHDDWSEQKLHDVWQEIAKIAKEEMELDPEKDLYPNIFEIVSSEQMIDNYASVGLPVMYSHWSFGKEFLKTKKGYDAGRQGLAFEIVINSNPCISSLMEDNDMVMQTMVMAHAGVGHNAVFKNNECFKQWTNAGSIVDYMIFARNYINQCEQRYGTEEVELVLDAAHTLAPHAVDKFKRKHKPAMSEEVRLQKLIEEDDRKQREMDIILKRTSFAEMEDKEQDDEEFAEGEENLMYFIMKKSPSLDSWKREILRIVYKVNQYFYPQAQTKNLNEGFASFSHYYIMTRLEEKGILSSDAYISFLHHHSSVIYQPSYNSRHYSGINPYAIGFAIFNDIKRICENPTAEDIEWFPNLIGRRWQDAIKEAAFDYRDDGFISQFLSPKVIRDLKLFNVNLKHPEKDSADKKGISALVTEIHDDVGYRSIRTLLAKSMERINYVPQIKVVGANLTGDRKLKLKYVPYAGRSLHVYDAHAVSDAIDYLWGYAVELDC